MLTAASFRLSALAWIALVPLLFYLERTERPREGAIWGLVFGVVFFGLDLRWIYDTVVIHGHFAPIGGIFTYAALVGALSLYPALFGLTAVFFRTKGLPVYVTAPFLWAAMEYARANLFTGFPWDLLGYSQAGGGSLIQLCDITGIYGVSFLIVLVNAALSSLSDISERTRRFIPYYMGITALCVGVVFFYGRDRIARYSQPVDSTCKIAALQGNIPQDVKWDEGHREETFATYERLGAQAVKSGARLLVWPETSVPVLFGSKDPDWKRPGEMSERLGVPMLVGAPFGELKWDEPTYYNSAILLDGPLIASRYDKIHLVPFGEYMPLSWLLPLGPGIAARELDYSFGERPVVMRTGDCPPFGVLICYEAIFPDLARAAVRASARSLINITNDGWFGHSAAPGRHLTMSAVRSVENRVWLLRSANTGISAAIDPVGRIRQSIPLEQEGFFIQGIAPSTGETLYCRYGDVFAFACLLVACFLMGGALFSKRR